MRTDITIFRGNELIAQEVNHPDTLTAMEETRAHWQPGDTVEIRTHLPRSYLTEVYRVTPELKLRFQERIPTRYRRRR